MASTLDHVEKTLADAYRKEIEQEENVWRSLPFFAGTLALQLAAMFQAIDRLPQMGSAAWWDSLGWIGIASISTLTALIPLAASRPIPPMLVAKRWWRKLERVPLEVLEAEDRAREAAEKARQEARRRR